MTGTPVRMRIVAVGLYVPGYGLTRVFEELFQHLSADFEIHWLGLAYRGEARHTAHYILYPSNLGGGDMYGAREGAALAIEQKADILWLLNDLYMLRNYSHTWHSLKEKGIRTIGYIPLDGEIIDAAILEDALFFDDLVLYTQWARGQVEQGLELSGKKGPALHVVHHGVDQDFFQPAPNDEKEKLRQVLFPDLAPDTILLLNANRYNERKDIPATIRAFEMAVPRFTCETKLLLHTPGVDKERLSELQTLVNRSEQAERILINPLGNDYVSEEVLRSLYQVCAVGINTSVGEGWGLISFEHAACGAVQVVPEHSAPAELWKGNALLVPAPEPCWLSTSPFRMRKIQTEILAEFLVQLVNNPGQRLLLSEKSRRLATSTATQWKKAAADWRKIFLHE